MTTQQANDIFDAMKAHMQELEQRNAEINALLAALVTNAGGQVSLQENFLEEVLKGEGVVRIQIREEVDERFFDIRLVSVEEAKAEAETLQEHGLMGLLDGSMRISAEGTLISEQGKETELTETQREVLEGMGYKTSSSNGKVVELHPESPGTNIKGSEL